MWQDFIKYARSIDMKRKLFSTTILGLGLLVGALFAANAQQPDVKLEPKAEQKTDFTKIFKSDREKTSYAIGMSSGVQLKSNFKVQAPDFDPDVDAIVKGFKEGLSGSGTLITDEQVREILNDFTKELRAKQQEKRHLQSEQNKKEGATFLAENKTKPGVVTLPSGLQYKVMTEGSGDSPKEFDMVTVNYRGTFINGTEFDSSFKHGQPATFAVKGVVKGWTEALLLMKPGAKWQLVIPSELAYGERGFGPSIGPDATLVFELELISVKAGSPPPPSAPLTSDIIKVPSAEEMKKGAKIETIKAEDAMKEQSAKQTNK
jgi:FKBP-type peptidyl-prolyl cis-trans isomerase FklB